VLPDPPDGDDLREAVRAGRVAGGPAT